MGIAKKIRLGFAKDLSYNVLALVIMNVVIQFVIYPYLNRVMGEEAFGTVLYLMSVIAVMAISFGLAVNNTRLIAKTKFETRNGDYNSLLVLFCFISIGVAVISLFLLGILNFWSGILFSGLMVLTLLRYYADVEFRIALNYRRYFLYYMLLTGGYLLGLLLYSITNNWYIVFIIGEAVCVLSVIFLGTIFKGAFQYSDKRKVVWNMTFTVAGAYLINTFFQNMDRIVLQNTLGGDAVTIFYTASVVGKTLGLLTGPINGVIIAYLSNYKGELSKKAFLKLILLDIGVSAVFFVGCVIVSPWLIGWLYPNVYEAARGLIVIGSLGQIMFFASALLITVMLRFCKTSRQFSIQLIYGIAYVALAIPMTLADGIYGFAWATLIACILRFIVAVITGYRDLGKVSEIMTEKE